MKESKVGGINIVIIKDKEGATMGFTGHSHSNHIRKLDTMMTTGQLTIKDFKNSNFTIIHEDKCLLFCRKSVVCNCDPVLRIVKKIQPEK